MSALSTHAEDHALDAVARGSATIRLRCSGRHPATARSAGPASSSGRCSRRRRAWKWSTGRCVTPMERRRPEGLFDGRRMPLRRRARRGASPTAARPRERRDARDRSTRTGSATSSPISTCTSSPRARTIARGSKLGAHRLTVGGVEGVHFAVWAPNAQRVSVIGDFNRWDGRVHVDAPAGAVRASGRSSFPGLPDGGCYKYEVRTRGRTPAAEGRSLRAALRSAAAIPRRSIWTDGAYEWRDGEWMRERESFGGWHERPMSIYEVHLGSWRRVPDERRSLPDYRELAAHARCRTCARWATRTSS